MAASRGAALPDFNLDGLPDLVVVNRGQTAQVWRNTTKNAGRWLEVRLHQDGANRDAIGSWIEVRAGQNIMRREITVGGGHASGWNTAANMYIWKNVGVTGDFSGVYHSGSNLLTYTAGPVVSTHKGSFSPYAHALFGGAHAATAGFGDSGMAMLFGGGLDFGRHRLVFRAVQLDWMTLRFNGITDKNNVRVNTGFLYRF